MEMKQILGRKILFVTAHPDDESYLAAGTMLKNEAAGGINLVACATFGERGKSHIKKKVTSAQLKAIRKKELLVVSKLLKVQELLMPGLPDARMGEKSHQDVFFKKLLRFAAKHSPEIIISFGNDGISGHIDHISAGNVAQKVARKLKLPILTFSAPPDLQNSLEGLKSRRKHGKYAKGLKHLSHDFKIRIDGKAKLKALGLHKSQLDADGAFSGLSKKTARQFLTHEYFSFGERPAFFFE